MIRPSMMRRFVPVLVAALLALGSVAPASALVVEGVRLDESAEVGGRSLLLNGGGVGLRLVFKVYAISLYLPERRTSAEAVLQADGPRRLVIRLLRDVGGDEFRNAMLEGLENAGARPEATRGMLKIGTRIAEQPSGLKKGDILTLDWVPSVGTVVELNRKPMLAPLPDTALYPALLNIWLGARAADTGLKEKLLGLAPERQASL